MTKNKRTNPLVRQVLVHVEGGDDRGGVGKAGGLDDDVVKLVTACVLRVRGMCKDKLL